MVQILRSISTGWRKAVVDVNIAALRPSEFFEALPERAKPRLCFGIILGVADQHPDAPHPFRLLRPGRDRPFGISAARLLYPLKPDIGSRGATSEKCQEDSCTAANKMEGLE